MVNRQLRRRRGAGLRGVATLELFYDLVFVFSITQVSHLLAHHLSWAGVGQSLIVLLAVWWSWNYTTWATNELDPETNAVRLLLIALMLGSMLMAISIPDAFGDRGLLFAIAYVSVQVGRHAFLVFAASEKGSIERDQAGRILAWFACAGVFWIAGGLVEGDMRVWIWLFALVLDYVAPMILFPVPGRPRLTAQSWHIATDHFAERFGLFVIAALGETIILTGATTAAHDLDPATLFAFVQAFVGTAALWWLYFTAGHELGEQALAREATRTRRARDVYTYGHVLIVAGIIATAVGDELVIAHPLDQLAPAQTMAVSAGPIVFLSAQLLFRLRVNRRVDFGRLAAIGACIAIALFSGSTPSLAVGGVLVAVLLGVVLLDERSRRLPPHSAPGGEDDDSCHHLRRGLRRVRARDLPSSRHPG